MFVTVGIASYNYARFLPRAFEAIRRQGFTDYEVLYCDDGSTDDSAAVIRDLAAKHPDMSIRLIEGQNEGVVANKLRILNNARGEYVMVCDADDWMLDGCLQTLADEAKRTGADRVIGQFKIVTPDGQTVRECDIADPSIKWLHTLWHGCLYRTSVFRDNAIDAPRDFFSDDYYLIMSYNLHCGDAAFVRKTLYCNYLHGQNATTVNSLSGQWKPMENFLQVMRFSREVCNRLTDERARETVTYQVVKFYEQAALTLAQAAKPDELNELYRQLRGEMRQAFPRYERNRLIRLWKPNYDRAYGKKGVWLMNTLERGHLLLPALKVYGRLKYSALFHAKLEK